jgi:hypothetical protein
MKTWSQGGEAYSSIGPGLVQLSPEQIAAIVPQLHGCARNRGILLIEGPHHDATEPEVICPGKEAGALIAGCARPDDPQKETSKAKVSRAPDCPLNLHPYTSG